MLAADFHLRAFDGERPSIAKSIQNKEREGEWGGRGRARHAFRPQVQSALLAWCAGHAVTLSEIETSGKKKKNAGIRRESERNCRRILEGKSPRRVRYARSLARSHARERYHHGQRSREAAGVVGGCFSSSLPPSSRPLTRAGPDDASGAAYRTALARSSAIRAPFAG